MGRAFVSTSNGRWARRPPKAFWGSALWDGGAVDVLELLRRVACPVTVLVCTSGSASGRPAEFFEAGRRGLQRHLRAIAAERPNVRVETIDATHGVIHERPADVARLIRSLTTA